MTDHPPQQGDALEAAAYELCAVNYPGGVSEDDALAILRRHGLRASAPKHHEHPTCAWSLAGDGSFRCTRPEGHNGLHSVVFGDDEHFRRAPAPDPDREALVERLRSTATKMHNHLCIHPWGNEVPIPREVVETLIEECDEAARALAAPAER